MNDYFVVPQVGCDLQGMPHDLLFVQEHHPHPAMTVHKNTLATATLSGNLGSNLSCI